MYINPGFVRKRESLHLASGLCIINICKLHLYITEGFQLKSYQTLHLDAIFIYSVTQGLYLKRQYLRDP